MRDSASYIVAQLMAVMLLGLGLAIGVALANIRAAMRLLRRAMAGMATVENSVETKATTERPDPIGPGRAPPFPADQPGAPHDISEIDISEMTIPDIGGRP